MGPQTSPSFFIMTRNKTGAFLSMGRIPKLIGHGAVAAGLVAGGASLLNAGGVMALNCPPDPSTVSHYSLTNCAISNPADVAITLTFPPATNYVSVDADFIPNMTNASGQFTYKIASTSGTFLDAFLGVDMQLGVPNVTKYVYATQSDLTLDINRLATVSPNTSQNLANQSLTEIWVKDVYAATTVESIDKVTNTFQTPGPLPILGAGAAFGFSRKLRCRIKAARLS